MANEKFLIGPALRDKLRDVISRVESLPYSESGDAPESRLQGLPQGRSLKLCKTQGYWNKGQTATLDVWTSTAAAGGTLVAANRSHPVAEGLFVVVARAGGEWTMVQSAMPSILKGTFTGDWLKGTTKEVSVTLSTGVHPEQPVQFDVSASNSFISVDDGGARSCAVAFDGSTFQLIAAECQ